MLAKKQSAYTMIEIIIVVAILGILAAAAMPNLSGFLQDNRLTSNTNTLVASLNYARGEAITRNRAVNITAISPSDRNNEWGPGWRIWIDFDGDKSLDQCLTPPTNCVDLDGDGTASDTEVLREIKPGGGGATMIDGPNRRWLRRRSLANVGRLLKSSTLSYRGDGTLAVKLSRGAKVSFTICDKRTGEKGRKIEINRIGRTALTDAKHSCS